MKRIFLLSIALVTASLNAQNVDFAQIKAWADEGVSEIEADRYLEAVMVSVPQNPNMGMNLPAGPDTFRLRMVARDS